MNKFDENDRITLSRAIASWFVRRDGKYYEIDNPTVPLALPDVQAACIERFREDHADIALSPDLLKATFKVTFSSVTAPAEERVGVWNGHTVSRPGCDDRLIRHRGMVSINAWSKPSYRDRRVNAADYGIAEDFFAWLFPRQRERDMVVDWVAWNLQNEHDKSTWTLFLHSRTKGSGKSTFCQLLTALFGARNTTHQNNVDKLTGRFNMQVLLSKLVISEELKLKAGATASNALKTYITEPTTLAEAKGREPVQLEQSCCFVFTTNHLPLWIEPGERRYLILDVDHDGHANGPRAAEFGAIVADVHQMIQDPDAIARLYNALMQRELSPGFDAKSLNTAIHATAIMRQIEEAARLVSTEQLREHLDAQQLNCIPESELVAYFRDHIRGNIESIRHKMLEIGWSKASVKWGGVDYARALWVRDGYTAYRGQLRAPDGSLTPITSPMEEAIQL